MAAYGLNVSRMLAGTGDMAWGFMPLVHAVFGASGIDAGTREVIGLRVARLLNVPYQWQQHVIMGRNAGLTEQEVAAIAADGRPAGLSQDRTLLCQATDELTTDAIISDATLGTLSTRYGDGIARKLVLTIAFFNLLGRFLNECRVPLEAHDKMGGRTNPF